MDKYYLVKHEPKDDEEGFKFIDFDDDKLVPEKIIDHYKLCIEAEGIEIFKVEGCQIMTEKGIYLVLRKDQITKTVFLNVEP